MKRALSLILPVWIAVGSAAVLHAMGTRGGIANPALLWELRHWRGIYPVETVLVLAIPLSVLPAGLLIWQSTRKPELRFTRARRRSVLRVTGALLFVVFAAFLYTGSQMLALYRLPDSITRIDAGDLPAKLSDTRAVVAGRPQTLLSFSYDEILLPSRMSGGRTITHTLTPITDAQWTADQPVRILTAMPLNGPYAPQSVRRYFQRQFEEPGWVSPPGWLFGGEIPGFVRTELAAHGVNVSPDVMLLLDDRAPGYDRRAVPTFTLGIACFVFLIRFVSALMRKPVDQY